MTTFREISACITRNNQLWQHTWAPCSPSLLFVTVRRHFLTNERHISGFKTVDKHGPACIRIIRISSQDSSKATVKGLKVYLAWHHPSTRKYKLDPGNMLIFTALSAIPLDDTVNLWDIYNGVYGVTSPETPLVVVATEKRRSWISRLFRHDVEAEEKPAEVSVHREMPLREQTPSEDRSLLSMINCAVGLFAHQDPAGGTTIVAVGCSEPASQNV